MEGFFLNLLRSKYNSFFLFLAFLFAGTVTLGANPSEEYPDSKGISFKNKESQFEIIKIFQMPRFQWPTAQTGLKGLEEFPYFIGKEVRLRLRTTAYFEEKIGKEEKRDNSDMLKKLMLELSYGRYKISDARYEEVYQKGREIYTSEIVRLLFTQNHHHFGLAAGIKSFTKKGHATVTQEPSKLTLIPIFLGLRYLLKVYNFIPWIEIGADYYLYKEKSDIKATSGSTFGYHVQGGFYLQIPKIDFIKLKIYAKHTKAKTKENNIEIDLGGFEYSLGLAFCFNLF